MKSGKNTKDQSCPSWDELFWQVTRWFFPVFSCMCVLYVWGLFKADDESPTNLHMEALLHSEEEPAPDFTCHYPGAAANSWFYGLWTAGMPNSVVKLPWLMSLQAVRTYFFKSFRWSFSIQPQNVLLLMLSAVTAPGKWLKLGQEVGVLYKKSQTYFHVMYFLVYQQVPAGIQILASTFPNTHWVRGGKTACRGGPFLQRSNLKSSNLKRCEQKTLLE